MQINSLQFLLYFIVIFSLYYFPLKEKTKAQNILLLLASYVFYGVANWKMLPLLMVATGVFYCLGILIDKFKKSALFYSGLLTIAGVCFGIGLLLYFKYLNFFINSFSNLFAAVGLRTNWHTINIIIPLGINFFTFKLISYVIEIHRQHIEPETDIVVFSVYVAFFPTLMAGPIDRPNTFIPQLKAKRTFDYLLAVDGCRQILWGILKKIVLADNIAIAVDVAWNNISSTSGVNLIIAAFLYSIQLYADFSGYSDMAIGLGKVLCFKISKNFNYPFFTQNIAEFWRNWHMSLTSWLTDYVFMPLNIKFRDMQKWGTIFAIIINFVLVGLWHGANWNFPLFGLYHSLFFIPIILSESFAKKRHKVSINKYGLPPLQVFMRMFGTFVLITVGNIIFRSASIGQAWEFMYHLSSNLWPIFLSGIQAKKTILTAIGLLIIEWYSYINKLEYALGTVSKLNTLARYSIYVIICLIIIFFNAEAKDFIYIQF